MSFGPAKYWVGAKEFYGALKSDEIDDPTKQRLRKLARGGVIGSIESIGSRDEGLAEVGENIVTVDQVIAEIAAANIAKGGLRLVVPTEDRRVA